MRVHASSDIVLVMDYLMLGISSTKLRVYLQILDIRLDWTAIIEVKSFNPRRGNRQQNAYEMQRIR